MAGGAAVPAPAPPAGGRRGGTSDAAGAAPRVAWRERVAAPVPPCDARDTARARGQALRGCPLPLGRRVAQPRVRLFRARPVLIRAAGRVGAPRPPPPVARPQGQHPPPP